MTKYEEPGVEPKLGDEITLNWQKQAEAELKNGYRVLTLDKFRNRENVIIHIFHPNQGIDSEASEAYGRTYSKFIKDPDIMTKKQLLKVLEEKGVWGAEEDALVESAREDMREIEFQVAKMRKAGNFNKDRMNSLRSQWFEFKNKLHTLLVEQQMILANTVEGYAESSERLVKLSHCVKFADGTRVWENVEAINVESDRIALTTMAQEATMFWLGLTNEIINELPAKLIFGGEETNQETSTDD